MEFRIADTFTESLGRLSGDEQKAVKTTAFDLQINPTSPGMSFHRLAKSRDRGFWSLRVNQDVRIIVHRTAQSLLLCYVDHHDRAYAWAERRKLETHPTTGAAQLVEVRERVQEVLVPTYVSQQTAAAAPKPPLFANVPEAELLGYGVPPEWLADVRVATEDTLLSLAGHLPAEAPRRCWSWRPEARPGSRSPPRAAGGPLRASRCPAALPSGGGRGRAGPRAGVPLGALDRVSPPRAAGAGRAPLRRARAHRRLGRDGQDRGGAASRRPSGSRQSRGAGAAHDLLGGAGELAPDQAGAADRH